MRLTIIGLILAGASLPLAAQTVGEAIKDAEQTHVDAAAGTPTTLRGLFGGLVKKAGGAAQGSVQGKRIQDTPAYKLFERFPVTDARNEPEWPKVAISMSYPAWLDDGNAVIGRFQGNQCIAYSLTHWANASTHQTYDNLMVCATDIPKVSHNTLRTTWPMFGTRGENTGQLRTTGPVPPSVPFPSDAASMRFLERGGVFYLGAVLSGLGFDWNYVGDHKRVWVVKVGELSSGSDRQASNAGMAAAASVGAGATAGSGGQAIASQCRADNFTGERFGKIAAGMSLEAVKRVIGCEPDTEFTRRSDDMVMYKWAVTLNNVVAAKAIDVFFDASGTKVKGAGKFKFSSGF